MATKLCAFLTYAVLGITVNLNFAEAAAKTTVRISKISVPSYVKQNTKTFYIKVELSGNPKFPVTLAYYPRACPKGCVIDTHSFAPLFATFTRKTTTLTLSRINACHLVDSTPVQFDYAVSVKDAKGSIAKPVSKGFTCVP